MLGHVEHEEGALADVVHRGVDAGDLRLVLGLGQGQELRRMRHDRRPDNAGTGKLRKILGHDRHPLLSDAGNLRHATVGTSA